MEFFFAAATENVEEILPSTRKIFTLARPARRTSNTRKVENVTHCVSCAGKLFAAGGVRPQKGNSINRYGDPVP